MSRPVMQWVDDIEWVAADNICGCLAYRVARFASKFRDKKNKTSYKVGQRVKKWVSERSFQAESFRGALMSVGIATYMLDVTLFSLLNAGITLGQLPPYTLDVAIICLGLVEAAMCVVWACLGQRVRLIFILGALAPAIASLLLLGTPNAPTNDDIGFCTGSNSSSLIFEGMTSAASGRLAIVIVVGVVAVASRAAVWTHGVPILDHGNPKEITLNFGILMSARVLGLVISPQIINHQPLWASAIGVTVPLVLHAFAYVKFEDPTPEEDRLKTEIGASFSRVLTSWQATAQMFATGFLAAALWGFNWHDTEIKKTRYLVTNSPGFIGNLADTNMVMAVPLAAVCYGIFYSRPPTFDRMSGLKLATLASLFVMQFYGMMTMGPSCTQGNVAGIGPNSGNYSQPGCSTRCRCAMPWSTYSPVCVVDTMTTYLSPCHAGCAGTDTIQGLRVLRDCACAPSNGMKRAALGACGEADCTAVLFTHRVFSVMAMIFTVICIQVQVVGILRTVESRDRRVAFGLTSAVVIFLTFGGAHLIYFWIQARTCQWFEAGRCHFHSPVFPYYIGSFTLVLCFFAFIVNLVTWIAVCRQSKKQKLNEIDVALDSTS